MEIAGHTSLVMDGGWWGMGEGLLMAEGKAGEERWVDETQAGCNCTIGDFLGGARIIKGG